MDHPWRPRPPSSSLQQGNICPTCSISHFPFCPPPPHQSSFNLNPRFQFQSHPDPFLQPLPFEPYYFDHRGPPVNPHSPFGDPRPWHRNPSLDRSPYGHVHPGYDDNSNSGLKRMKVDESENERRLKLIRDHGGLSGGASGNSCENKGYFQEISGFDRSFGNFDGGEHEKFDKTSNNFELGSFRGPSIGNFDGKGALFHQDPGCSPPQGSEDNGFGYGLQSMRSNRNVEHQQSKYGRSENYLGQSYPDSGYGTHPAGQIPTFQQRQHSQDVGGSYHGCNLNPSDGHLSVPPNGDMNQELRRPHSSPYSNSEACNENYSSQNVQGFLSANSYDEHNRLFTECQRVKSQLLHPYTKQNPMELKFDSHNRSQLSDMGQPCGDGSLQEGIQGANGHQNFPAPSEYGPPNSKKQGCYLSIPSGTNMGLTQASHVYGVQPPPPASPPPPPPSMEPSGRPLFESYASLSPPKTSSSLFPIAASSSENTTSSYPPAPEPHLISQTYQTHKSHLHPTNGFITESISQSSSNKYVRKSQTFPPRHQSLEKPKVIDAAHVFKHPHRAARPDHIVIILRGLPGSGKSYLAKMLRDMEVESGSDAPRIYSMDDYFMTEVEKVEENEAAKSSVRGKKPVTRKVMEYCYEPEMEEAYRTSMLKAFKKTLDEGVFSFIIVDDRNLRVADFAQFWATAKRSGYEVYLLEAPYKDPAGCAARNVHGFSQDDIQKMAGQWEEAPSLYMKLDIKSLLHGDELEENKIQEVDMDAEDGDPVNGPSISEETDPEKAIVSSIGDAAHNGASKDDMRWEDTEGDHPTDVKELRRSKWSNDLDEDDLQGTEKTKGDLGALSGLVQVYGKESKSVCWGDKVGNTGFLIGAARKANMLSLIIGPGAGYNLKSNPLPEEEDLAQTKSSESRRQNIFQERLRAEHESFKAVFDKRRQRVGGLLVEDE